MKNILRQVFIFALISALAIPVSAADTVQATTLRLEQTEGTVDLANKLGKAVSIINGMKLFNGYQLRTDPASYAHMSLDSTNLVKMDASSHTEVAQRGNKFEVLVHSGNILINVSEPLNDGNLDIRTSSMVTSIRGTAVLVRVIDEFNTEVLFLDGHGTISVLDPLSGEIKTMELYAGQKALLRTASDRDGLPYLADIQTGTVTEQDISGFVAVELAENPELAARVQSQTALDVNALIAAAYARLASDEEKAEQKHTEILTKMAEQVNLKSVDPLFVKPEEVSHPETPVNVPPVPQGQSVFENTGADSDSSVEPPAAEPVPPVVETPVVRELEPSSSRTSTVSSGSSSGSGSDSGSGGSSDTTPTTPPITPPTEPASAVMVIEEDFAHVSGNIYAYDGEIEAKFNEIDSITLKSNNGSTLNATANIDIPAGKTLTLDSGTLRRINDDVITTFGGPGYFLTNYGVLIIKNSTVDSLNWVGGGIGNWGTFTMEGGSLLGNLGNWQDSDASISGGAIHSTAYTLWGQSPIKISNTPNITSSYANGVYSDINSVTHTDPNIRLSQEYDSVNNVWKLSYNTTTAPVSDIMVIEEDFTHVSGNTYAYNGEIAARFNEVDSITLKSNNGSTLDSSVDIVVPAEKILTLESGTVSNNRSYSDIFLIACIDVHNRGVFVMTSGAINSKNDGIFVDGGSVNISGGSIEAGEDGVRAEDSVVNISDCTVKAGRLGIFMYDNSNVTIYGGTIEAGEDGVQSQNNSTVEIFGDTIEAGDRGVAAFDSTVTISDCTIEAGDIGVRTSNSAVTINSGIITGKDSQSYGISNNGGSVIVNNGTISGSNSGILNRGASGTITIQNGTITGYWGIQNSSSVGSGTGNVIINGGTIMGYYGIRNNGNITISGNSTTIHASDSYAFENFSSIQISDAPTITSNGSGIISDLSSLTHTDPNIQLSEQFDGGEYRLVYTPVTTFAAPLAVPAATPGTTVPASGAIIEDREKPRTDEDEEDSENQEHDNGTDSDDADNATPVATSGVTASGGDGQ